MRRRLVLPLTVSVALLAAQANAQTQPRAVATVPIATPTVATVRGADTVVLKDGTVLRGTIDEMTPGQAVTITLPSGEHRTLPWAALDRVDIARARPTAAPSQTTVHLDGARDDVVLQSLDSRRGTEAPWQTVCRGACDRPLPSDNLYRIDGPGLRTSKPFKIEGASASYRVSTASSAGFALGLTLLIVGGAALLNGVGFLVVAAVDNAQFGRSIDVGGFAIAGAVLSGIGLPSTVVGLVLMKMNGRTTATLERDAASAPTWMPRATGFNVPVLAGTF
jgi:hypothetical protein